MSEKIYCNAAIVKSKRFDDGNEMLKVSVKVEEMVGFLNQHAENGWVNLNIQKRKQPGGPKGDITHSVILDTWKPSRQQASAPASAPVVAPAQAPEKADDLPF